MARSRLILALSLAAVGAGGAVAAATIGSRTDDPAVPATEHVLLRAPSPSSATRHGVFVRDPQGRIERIAATGHLVAWSVRTPAERLDLETNAPHPLNLPKSSRVVVVDERGGAPASVELRGRWVDRLHFVRSSAGTRSQLAIRSCTTRARSSCASKLVAIETMPKLALGGPRPGALAADAAAGHVDLGRRLRVGARVRLPNGTRSCAPRLSVETIATGRTHALPPIPEQRQFWKHCVRLREIELHGPYALATMSRREHTARDESASEGDTIEVLQLNAPQPRWIESATIGSITDYDGFQWTGTAYTPHGAVWQDVDSSIDGQQTYGSTTLLRLRLPEGLNDPTDQPAEFADAVSPKSRNGCALAATNDAIYELANQRCAIWPTDKGGAGAEIRRVVNPNWRNAPPG